MDTHDKTLPDLHRDHTGLRFIREEIPIDGGDQGDGTYRNYILYADYADPDVLRVGDDFYLVVSTFHLHPGLTLLHSKDLVNWRILDHVIDNLALFHPDFSFNAMQGYGYGIWAPSLRYHDGTFYIHVGGPKIGLLVCKAPAITGPWTVRRMKQQVPWHGNKLIDCCPLWDDDGQAYFVAAEPRWFADRTVPDYRVHLFRMSPDGEALLDGGTIVHGGRLTEAFKLYKRDGYYYMLYCEHPYDEDGARTQFAARARHIYGPYERRKLIHSHGPQADLNPSQGGLVDTPDGAWWFLCHGDSPTSPTFAVGRPLMLLPVTWEDGWPKIGEDLDGDGLGEMVWRHAKPVQGELPSLPATSDAFDGPALDHQWQWNHQPRGDAWSLSARPGFLRLTACKPAFPGGFYGACNTLTQPLMGMHGEITTQLHTEHMSDGQYAGLCLMADPSQLIGVYQENGVKRIRYQYTRRIDGSQDAMTAYSDDHYGVDLAILTQDMVYLRVIHHDGKAQLCYSLDGESYMPAHEQMAFAFFAWRGGRVGLFSWNDFADGGYGDFAWLNYQRNAE